MTKLGWKVNTPSLLKEILESNNETWALAAPLNILRQLLAQTAKRAIELDDEELNKLMMRLALYSVAEPGSPDFDQEFVNDYLGESLNQKGGKK